MILNDSFLTTVACAARRIGRSKTTIRRLVTTGRLTGYRSKNGMLWVAVAEIDVLLTEESPPAAA